MAKGISRKDYVNNLRDMLDMAFENKYCPGDEETEEHVRDIREHFEKRPTKWQYTAFCIRCGMPTPKKASEAQERLYEAQRRELKKL